MDRATLWERLDAVLDPELDESIVRLGFVHALEQTGDTVRVVLRLPTYWCSPNFAYLMADGVRRALLDLPGITAVRVEVEDHFASRELSDGVTAGRSFHELFPDEASEDLEELRRRFLVKGYLSRLLVLIQAFRQSGAQVTELTEASLSALQIEGDHAWLRTAHGERGPVRARIVERYLVRRAELALPLDASAPLLLRPDGEPIGEEGFDAELRRLRATVVNLRASTALCEALLASRQQW
ncbi:iron-sulfur cluster assembly protein [Thermomicrobium sp. 4228-Ro]|uniref:iron-sulfur cluster assembly protein n=1 Tax=Thermomicrobium sp. 4228-Ro TaxID=2993937 RepID=UPI00224879C4|nr:iron-sulfur cluster assembly protein [Thermomicrobium sp. 4228-Ro]MCX2728454.1 iron-sulfur cluster assembly protein [Thermomicrobium sp. 4228-Ro]